MLFLSDDKNVIGFPVTVLYVWFRSRESAPGVEKMFKKPSRHTSFFCVPIVIIYIGPFFFFLSGSGLVNREYPEFTLQKGASSFHNNMG